MDDKKSKVESASKQKNDTANKSTDKREEPESISNVSPSGSSTPSSSSTANSSGVKRKMLKPRRSKKFTNLSDVKMDSEACFETTKEADVKPSSSSSFAQKRCISATVDDGTEKEKKVNSLQATHTSTVTGQTTVDGLAQALFGVYLESRSTSKDGTSEAVATTETDQCTTSENCEKKNDSDDEMDQDPPAVM